jgi:hypothetical protein
MLYLKVKRLQGMLSVPNARTWRRLHATLTITWAFLLIPSVLWWSESIKWIVLMSVWANIAGHFAAWQGSRAEDSNTSTE